MWLLKAAIFFTLFAFALNNQQAIAVNFFFGAFWNAPLVLVVFAVFSAGLVLGVLLMMPHWWKKRKQIRRSRSLNASLTIGKGTMQLTPVANEASGLSNIPRDGL